MAVSCSTVLLMLWLSARSLYLQILPQHCRYFWKFHYNTVAIFQIFASIFGISACRRAAIFCLFDRNKYLPPLTEHDENAWKHTLKLLGTQYVPYSTLTQLPICFGIFENFSLIKAKPWFIVHPDLLYGRANFAWHEWSKHRGRVSLKN